MRQHIYSINCLYLNETVKTFGKNINTLVSN